MTYYVNSHESQYGPGRSDRTRASGCTWTTGANGMDAATGGRIDPEPDGVLSKLARTEETNPATPGWSLVDLRKASGRLGVVFAIRSGTGWAKVVEAHNDGYYIVLQGDSDQFADGSCSGAFDGDHCVGITPISKDGRWLIDDPICALARYEYPATLKRYAEDFNPNVSFGVYQPIVPQVEDDDMIPLFDVLGRQRAKFKTGAKLYDKPGGSAVATVTANWYELCAKDKATTPQWYLVGRGGSEPMVYGRESDITAREQVPPTSGKVTVTIGDVTYGGSITT